MSTVLPTFLLQLKQVYNVKSFTLYPESTTIVTTTDTTREIL